MKKPGAFSIALLFIFLAGIFHSLKSQVLDQSHLNNNGPVNARTLRGYGLFQSFTAGITGTLTNIEMVFVDSLNATGWVRIYTGTDTTGGLLQVTPVTIPCAGAPCWANFAVSVPVFSGQPYTFRFVPGTGVPDPFYMQGEYPGTYAGGRLGFINPYVMNYFSPDRDFVFKTYVMTSPVGIKESALTPVFLQVFPNPAGGTVMASWVNTDACINELLVTDVSGKIIRQLPVAEKEKDIKIYDLPKGLYFVTFKNIAQQPVAARKIVID